jgi:hypothetical protein
LDIQQQRIERYRKTNALEAVHPAVLIDEVPWGEIKDAALMNLCAPELDWLETHLRQTLYQWDHFQVDLVVPPVFSVYKRLRWQQGIGIEVQDHQIKGDTGAYISAHAYQDQLQTEELFKECGLLYYGCCEPMDLKIDILRKRFKNLRKISITPWADPQRAARNMGGDYVMAAKPNPAFVAMPEFNPHPVEQEITSYCEACREQGTPVEFVLKDISTIANNPANLTQWAATVQAVIDQYYS